MQCDDVARALPELLDNHAPRGRVPGGHDGGVHLDDAMRLHVETCLRCQAEMARYRRMLRGLQSLRGQYLEPAPGLLAHTLANLEAAGERKAVHSALSGRRLAYVGAVGGASLAAAGAVAVVVITRSRRQRTPGN